METAPSGRLLAARGRAGSSIGLEKSDSTCDSRAFANQNTAINVLPFEGVYAFITSITHHFLNDCC